MKDRILKLLAELDISSTKLAEEINVQRSSISHILSGRNKPSFDFIQKLLKRYPNINSRWLFLGEGNIFSKEKQASIPFQESDNKAKADLRARESNIQSETPPNYQIKNSESVNKETATDIKIKKIVIFYTDNSFEEYLPKDSK